MNIRTLSFFRPARPGLAAFALHLLLLAASWHRATDRQTTRQ